MTHLDQPRGRGDDHLRRDVRLGVPGLYQPSLTRPALVIRPRQCVTEVRGARQWSTLLIQEQEEVVVDAEQQDRAVRRVSIQLIHARVGEFWRAMYDSPGAGHGRVRFRLPSTL